MKLNLPVAQLDIQSTDGGTKVFDSLRHKYVALTPEEFVRQNFTSYLINYLGFPAGLMANEIGITLNGTSRRCDTVVFDHSGKPLVIIEYKAPKIRISQLTFDQIVRYNITLKARYLIVSNGLQHYCCRIDYTTMRYDFLPAIPNYKELMAQNR
jgi:hypothetical protein